MNVWTKATTDPSPMERELRHRALAREVGGEAIVLLENDGTLPLAPGALWLYGAGAAATIKGGTGSGEVNEREAVTIREGLEAAGFEIAGPSRAWLDEYLVELAAAKTRYNKRFARRSLKLITGDDDARINFAGEPFRYPVGRALGDADLPAPSASVEPTTCIYVIARQAGECSDRRLDRYEYTLEPVEIANLVACAGRFDRVIVVINVATTIDLTPLDSIAGISAVVHFSQLGMEGGNALADVLTGAVAPSGCLTATWPKRYSDWPFADEYSYRKGDLADAGQTHREFYREGIYVGYRYFDSFGVEPRYPFGFGLTYSEFVIEALGWRYGEGTGSGTPGSDAPASLGAIDTASLGAVTENTATKHTVGVTARVMNTGQHSGRKVVQLYASAPAGALEREHQGLVAFAKTSVLAPGESENLELRFSLDDLAGYDAATSSWILEPGTYVLRLGSSSRDTTPAVALRIAERVTTEQCRPICLPEVPIDELSSDELTAAAGTNKEAGTNSAAGTSGAANAAATPDAAATLAATDAAPAADPSEAEATPKGCSLPKVDELPILDIDPADFTTITHDYSPPRREPSQKVASWLASLTTEEKVGLLLGTGWRASATPGNLTVPGAAAITATNLVTKGIASVALADGPAGVRVQRRFVVLPNGKTKPLDAAIGWFEGLPAPARRLLHATDKQGPVRYQHATAFPVGVAMAQTWNAELLGRVGDAIGTEMIEFGVTFWLAPGMNIQRNPLCGRNYEYYSEDPMLTGSVAAAIIKGVQAHDGCYVTVKHFAANNQEYRRNRSDSVVGERALREIYLRAFAKSVREGGAKAVMTSYNLLNGVRTVESPDLNLTALRNEWGFTGVVMSDWLATGKGQGSNGGAVQAGNDLIMPGGKAFRKALEEDIAAGKLTAEAIDAACINILELIATSRTQAEFEARRDQTTSGSLAATNLTTPGN